MDPLARAPTADYRLGQPSPFDAAAPVLQPYAGMGALDDAIREHLALKRKHGASEEEVAKQEREALEVGALPSHDEPQTARADGEQQEAQGATEAPPTRPTAEPGERSEQPAATEGLPAFPASDELERDEVLPEETLEPERHRNGDAQGENVLEETPDFLEEAPEHDRLWFEQRPPRDFDFDG